MRWICSRNSAPFWGLTIATKLASAPSPPNPLSHKGRGGELETGFLKETRFLKPVFFFDALNLL